jgi:hypothetical protein
VTSDDEPSYEEVRLWWAEEQARRHADRLARPEKWSALRDVCVEAGNVRQQPDQPELKDKIAAAFGLLGRPLPEEAASLFRRVLHRDPTEQESARLRRIWHLHRSPLAALVRAGRKKTNEKKRRDPKKSLRPSDARYLEMYLRSLHDLIRGPHAFAESLSAGRVSGLSREIWIEELARQPEWAGEADQIISDLLLWVRERAPVAGAPKDEAGARCELFIGEIRTSFAISLRSARELARLLMKDAGHDVDTIDPKKVANRLRARDRRGRKKRAQNST